MQNETHHTVPIKAREGVHVVRRTSEIRVATILKRDQGWELNLFEKGPRRVLASLEEAFAAAVAHDAQ